MKATEKIYDAIRICMENKDDNPNFGRINGLLTEFISANDTPKKPKNGPDIWKFVSKDAVRPVMNGVCYVPENRVAVATDAHVLLMSKPDYAEREAYTAINYKNTTLPAGIYNKKGERPKGVDESSKFPCVWAIFEGYETKPAQLNDWGMVEDAVKKAKIALKAKSANWACIEIMPDMWIKTDYVELMLTMPDRTKFRCRDCDNPEKFMLEYRDENYTAAFMPIIKPESNYKTTAETDGILTLVK